MKLFATKGKEYDLVVTSDYCIELLIRQKLLQKLDKTKLPFWHAIHPVFLGHYYDPLNEYSIPSDWYVLGFDRHEQRRCGGEKRSHQGGLG